MSHWWKHILAAVVICAYLIILGALAGCQDTSQPYVIVHQDGRVWEVLFEPGTLGPGLLSGKPFCWGFRNAEGFRCAVSAGNSRVVPKSEFDFDPSRHHYTYEHVWEFD